MKCRNGYGYFSSIKHGVIPVSSGPCHIPAVDPLVPQDVPPRREDHQEDNHDAEEDEGDGAEGDILQVAAGQRSGH